MLADSGVVMVAIVMNMEQVMQRFSINKSARKSGVLFIGQGEGDARMVNLQLKGQPLKKVKSLFTSEG